MKTAVLLLALTVAGAAHAAAVPECRIRILRPVGDDMGDRWPAGKLVPVDIMRRDEKGISFCAHGGSCTPRSVNGVQVVQLANCRPGKSIGNGDYALDPNPAAMGAAGTRRFLSARKVADTLSTLGFSNAAIGAWSNSYATAPASQDGRLISRALAGSQPALAAMKAKLP